MIPEHQQWIDQATELARTKRYDQARELALRVIREDGRNTKALWIVASVTESLTERRNALNALLRLQPENLHARHMLNNMNQTTRQSAPRTTIKSIASDTPSAIHALSMSAPPVYLYAVLASLVLVVVATVASALIF